MLKPTILRARHWLLPALLFVALGAALALGAVYLVAPVLPLQNVGGVWADVNDDGALDFIESARVVFAPAPKAAAGQ